MGNYGDADLYTTVAYDKGKPAARQGRKAVSLFLQRLIQAPIIKRLSGYRRQLERAKGF